MAPGSRGAKTVLVPGRLPNRSWSVLPERCLDLLAVKLQLLTQRHHLETPPEIREGSSGIHKLKAQNFDLSIKRVLCQPIG
jgi:hypothetical protein